MTKPEILLVGPYPEWDLVELDAKFEVRKLYEATDRDVFLRSTAATSAGSPLVESSAPRPS